MIQLKTLADTIQNGLNSMTGTTGIRYRVFADAGDFEKAKHSRTQLQKYTNGLLRVVSSSVVPTQGLVVATMACTLDIVVQLLHPEQDEKVIEAHRAILDAYFRSTDVQMIDKFSVAATYAMATTGIVQAEAPLGTYMSFRVSINYGTVENGLNSSSIRIYFDKDQNPEPIPYDQCKVSRIPVMDAATYSDGNGAAKNIPTSTAFQCQLSFPATPATEGIQGAMRDFLFGGNMAQTHTLSFVIDTAEAATQDETKDATEETTQAPETYTYTVVFGDTDMSLVGVKNAGCTVTFVEAAPFLGA